MAILSHRTIRLDVSEIVTELRRLNHNLEQLFQTNAPKATPEDFDVDEYCSVSYFNEEQELIDQHIHNTVGGVRV